MKAEESLVYFLLFILNDRDKSFAVQPQTICSEVP